MKRILYISLALLTLASCKEDKKDMIAGRWQATALDNAQMDQMMKDQMAFTDTFGSHTDAVENKELYGTQNIDSMRESLKMQLQQYKVMQESAVKNTWFLFRKDGVALMNFSGNNDSANWYFDEEGALMLDEMKLKGAGNILKMEVMQLTKKDLKLKFSEDGMTSTVTFVPQEN